MLNRQILTLPLLLTALLFAPESLSREKPSAERKLRFSSKPSLSSKSSLSPKPGLSPRLSPLSKPALSSERQPSSKYNPPSQNNKDSEVLLISLHSPVQKNQSFLIGILIKIPQGWHSYWSFAGEFGQAPKIKWRPEDHVLIEALPFPAPERKTFSIMKKPSYSFIYEKELLIPFQVFINENYRKKELNLFLDMEWSICKELCLSRQTQAQLNLKIAPKFKVHMPTQRIFNSWTPLFPKELKLKSDFKVKDKQQIINFSFEEEIICKDLFPAGPTDFSSAPAKLLNQGPRSCSFQVEQVSSRPLKISGLMVYSKAGQKQSALFQSEKKEGLSFIWFILMAFIGGLILNFMPCVLPIIFLKFYNTLELKHLSSGKILSLNLSYAFGVISSFLFLALFIFVSKKTGETLGWGFHLQSPVFVTALSVLFTLMAFHLLNVFSFAAPRLSLFFKDEKIFSHFLTGVLSTTAASPCTVPFMVSAVGFGLSRSYMEVLVIFFFLGLGLSSPYLVLSLFPKALRYIPGPGRKTEILKQLLSIPLFLTTVWLLKILYFQVSLKVFIFSLIAFPILLLWLVLQRIIQKSSFKLALNLIFIFLALLFFIEQKNLHRSFQSSDSSDNQTVKQNLIWLTFDKESLKEDMENGENVFAAFGAEWCLTCKFNERIFKSNEFLNLTRQNKIRLYYGDWTTPDPEITKFLEQYNQKGVPFYIFFKGEEKYFIFPTLLFKESFLKNLKELSG